MESPLNNIDDAIYLKDLVVKEVMSSKENLFKQNTSEGMLFIYKNERVGCFVEFKVPCIDPNITAQEAIKIFMQKVVDFAKGKPYALPELLLEELSDEDIKLFLLTDTGNTQFDEIQKMIYIQKEYQYYYDYFGFEYTVIGEGLYDSILVYLQDDMQAFALHIHTQQLYKKREKLDVIREYSI